MRQRAANRDRIFGGRPCAQYLQHSSYARALRIAVAAHLQHHVILAGGRQQREGHGTRAFLDDEKLHRERPRRRESGEQALLGYPVADELFGLLDCKSMVRRHRSGKGRDRWDIAILSRSDENHWGSGFVCDPEVQLVSRHRRETKTTVIAGADLRKEDGEFCSFLFSRLDDLFDDSRRMALTPLPMRREKGANADGLDALAVQQDGEVVALGAGQKAAARVDERIAPQMSSSPGRPKLAGVELRIRPRLQAVGPDGVGRVQNLLQHGTVGDDQVHSCHIRGGLTPAASTRSNGLETEVMKKGVLLAVSLVFAVSAVPSAQRRTGQIPTNPDDKTVIHVLNRIGFGAAPGDVERVRKMGLAAYLEQQLQPERLADEKIVARLANFETLTMSTEKLAEEYYLPAQMIRRQAQRANASSNDPAMQPGDPASGRQNRTPEQMQAAQAERKVMMELTQQKLLRAAYSEKQLQEVMVDFWFNHFNVFAGKGQTRIYLTEYERDTIRPHVFGKFRDLLGAVAESPAMLFYLDNWQSSAPEGSAMESPERRRQQMGRRPGQRGRPGLIAGRPGQGATMADLPPGLQNRRPRGLNENYARELMELHTLGVDGGYTQKDVQEIARAFTGWTLTQPRRGGGFVFEPRMHDDGEKVVLGLKIKSGGGKKDGEQVLDLLAKHPSTARFIATKLARRFVADEPPKELVDRAAAAFQRTAGDIREVVRTIVTSPEFFARSAYRAKVKSPFEFVASSLRASGADAVNGLPLVQAMRDLGMPLYMCQPPTGYSDRADAWVNTGALLNRMNFSVALASGRLRGITLAPGVDQETIVTGALAGDLSESTRTTVAKATTTPQAVALVLGSPEFQRK